MNVTEVGVRYAPPRRINPKLEKMLEKHDLTYNQFIEELKTKRRLGYSLVASLRCFGLSNHFTKHLPLSVKNIKLEKEKKGYDESARIRRIDMNNIKFHSLISHQKNTEGLDFKYLLEEMAETDITIGSSQEVIMHRIIACVLYFAYTSKTQEQISKVLGVDRSTIAHYKKVFEDKLYFDVVFKKLYESIADNLCMFVGEINKETLTNKMVKSCKRKTR